MEKRFSIHGDITIHPADDRLDFSFEDNDRLDKTRGIVDGLGIREKTKFLWFRFFDKTKNLRQEIREVPESVDVHKIPVGCGNVFADICPWIGEHPDYPVEDWQCEVANGDTRLGYIEWAFNKQKADG